VNWVGALLLVAGFVGLIPVFKLDAVGAKVISLSRRTVADLLSSQLSDDEKEAAMRQHSKALFLCFWWLLVGGALAVALPAAGVFGLELLGVASLRGAVATTLRWEFIASATAVGAVLWFVWRRR